MKLSRKLHITTITFTLFSILIISLVISSISMSNYMEVEKANYQNVLFSFERAIIDDFEEMELILFDWTRWDATYDYILGKNESYVEENIGDNLNQSLKMDYILILNEEDEVLYGNAYDLESDAQLQMSDEIVSDFARYPESTGIIRMDGHLVFYASMKITDNNSILEPKGLMVFGKILNVSMLEEFEKETTLDLDYYYEDYKNTEEKIQSTNAYGIVSKLVHNRDENSIIKISVPVVNEDRRLCVESSIENQVQKLGREHIRENTILVLIVLGVFGFLIDLAFRKVVVGRLILLNKQISAIRTARSIKDRVSSSGSDEIGELSENINAMLEEIDIMHQEVKNFATYDEMTGVYNRRVGFDILDSCIEASINKEIFFSIIYIDIDNLKKVNDDFGHIVGDKLIKDTASIIKSTVNSRSEIIRMGGDEFLVILKNKDLNDAQELVKDLKDAMKTFNDKSQREYQVSFSCGTAQYKEGQRAEEIIEIADIHMYEEKGTL